MILQRTIIQKGVDFSHVVTGNVTDVTPVTFTETVLVLTAVWSARDLCMWFEEVVNSLSDKSEVAVCDHLEWVFANDAN